ncbi:hypothetical protein [Lysinibacillus sp. SGAir0095]|uniref:hypothetical protein n=1 Tax=Lysinibacillus sp. SGAir0095 TaxID=2070463 RepID=UPI0010CCEECE|nr:hypothetical protein [Lysinibacillus sp. SGAir0095]QCR31260.1 hypothetical protein C1N55_03395 [Lysinibacillus sp. SGAir0095]
MGRVVGEIKVERFLENLIQQLPYEMKGKQEFMYRFEQNNSMCSIGYEKNKTFFSKAYNLTVKIEKEVQSANAEKQEVRYLFHRQKWTSKKESPLLKIANRHFRWKWNEIDLEKLTMVEEKQKRTFKMSILPGSYNVLLFPPLTQGIELYPNELKCLVNWIDVISKQLDGQYL